MCGFLTEKFLLKKSKILTIFLEKEISFIGYYSITGLFFMLFGCGGALISLIE
jgi:hypothetical protein